MHLSSGLSLALLSTVNSFAYAFSMGPHKRNSPTSHRAFPKQEPILSSHNVLAKRSPLFTDLQLRGGQTHAASSVSTNEPSSSHLVDKVASLVGAGGVVMILAKAIKRVLPIALEPFGSSAVAPLTTFQLGAYISMCLFFAYAEGYKGFQRKFSPLVVARAQTLKPFNGTPIHHTLLAPFYSMGLFHATKKRKIVSWSVTIGVGIIVAAVKKLPYPWRNIVDAGVIVGLSWGSLSIIVEWVKAALLGIETTMDPALPNSD